MLNVKKHYRRRIFNIIYVTLITFTSFTLTLFTGCSPKTSETSLPFDSPETFSEPGSIDIHDRWWTVFKDTTLNRMIEQALESNFSLNSAWQRLMQAEAILDRETSGLFPDLELFADGELNRIDNENTENLQLGLASSYEIDLWGRINAGIDAEEFRAEATFSDYQTAALSISAEIVTTWYQLMEALNQLELAERQIETNEKVLKLIKARWGSGQIRSVDILRQSQLLESTRALKINVESRIEVLEHQLAVLLGRPPQERIDYAYDKLPELSPLPKTGIPVELVNRRPDVKSAYYLLMAADRDLAAAISSQYPRLSFSASVTTNANSANNLFENWVYSFAGNLLAPIFYGGELSAEVDRSEAFKKQRLYEYGQVVLVAFRDVENALVREKKQVELIENLQQQLALSEKSYEQLRIEYFNGVSNYLDVLTALDELQQLRRSLISAKLILIEYRISLYRSLAGGFETEREKEE